MVELPYFTCVFLMARRFLLYQGQGHQQTSKDRLQPGAHKEKGRDGGLVTLQCKTWRLTSRPLEKLGLNWRDWLSTGMTEKRLVAFASVGINCSS